MTTTCIAAHHDDPPLALPGLRLCQRHRTRLATDLDAIITLWPLLAELAAPGSGHTSGHNGKPGPRPPCDLDILDITDPRGEVHQQVGGWARILTEERRLATAPAGTEQAARLLAVHIEWLAAQPYADEAADEIRAAAHQIRRACRDLPDPPVGKCPDIDPRAERDTCGGPLRWVDGSTALVCGACGSAWADADMPHLLRVVRPSAKFPVPRAWVAARYNLEQHTLRQWIRRGHVKTYADEQVELFDVLKRVQEGTG